MKFTIDNKNITDVRLDVFLKDHLEYSRSFISKLIDDGYVSINNDLVYKPSYKLRLNDIIEVSDVEIVELDVTPQNIPLDIIFEDDDILIINKERGMVVHPSNGHLDNTLVNAVMYHCKDNLSHINGVIRPGIVHRIDKDTSGILCICKNDKSHNNISEQFSKHTNIRKYKAIVKGVIKDDSGEINKPIGRDKNNRLRMGIDLNGKEAITKFKVIERFNNYTLIECELLTGRTHQIRVHMKSIGYPLLGDLVYGSKDKNFKDLDGQILHAYYLELDHPASNKRMKFECDLPNYFKEIISKIAKL